MVLSRPDGGEFVARERWATKIGLILALAGNAIGLGNFLRFPRQAAEHGGGAFMIPYFVCLLVIGIPLVWVELSIGRLGGRHGRGHTAGMFEVLWAHPISKYVGALGIFIPFVIACYYIFVSSWCLAYSMFSLSGSYFGLGSFEAVSRFLAGYQGVESNEHFASAAPAYGFFAVAFVLNVAILLGGIAKGIERLALWAMPMLFVFAAILAIRVLTLEPPAGAGPDQTVLNGLGFVWNPDFGAIADPKVWLAAAGQIFFTLSVGWGILHTYASYIGPDDDLALTGLSTASLNEFAEVVLGGTIALTAAVVFFGVAESARIASQGSFDLGFHAMPLALEQMPGGRVFGGMWFLLLFFAGITSSVAMLQPTIALLREDFGFARAPAVIVTALLALAGSLGVIAFFAHGVMDQLDFWAGSFGLLLFGFVEIVVFTRLYGMAKGWDEINRGAKLRVPRLFWYVIAWVMPLALAAILVSWSLTNLGPELSLDAVAPADRPYVVGARVAMVAGLVACWLAVRAGSRRRAARESEA